MAASPRLTGPIGLALMSLAAGSMSCGGPPRGGADLVLHNGRIVTLDDDRPEARALAVADGRIVAVGSDPEIRSLIDDSTRVLDLEGRLAIPGFIEGHGHFLGLGESLTNLRLDTLVNWEAVVTRVAEAVATTPHGDWIVGRGWHQEKWTRPPRPAVNGYPLHDGLSAVSPDHPVFLVHASGHAAVANAAALAAAGIDRSTPDPAGGSIVRGPDGEPTGLLHEEAKELVRDAMERSRADRSAEQVAADIERLAALASREALAHGVTSFQDAGSSFESVDVLRDMAEGGGLGVRLWVMLSGDQPGFEDRIDDYRIRGAGNDHLTVRAVKRYVDGALGNRGAWLLAPYEDRPGTSGTNTTSLEELEATTRIAADHGFQMCVHAIGDRGNREVLDLYERVLAERPDRRELRWRIEHVQHLDPADVPRFAELGVVASMQGVHCTSDGPWVPKRIGERRAADGAYLWRDLLDSGAVVTNGTDVPVESIDPIANFHALVTRKTASGERFHPAQRMTRDEALRASTLAAAYAAFEDDFKGSLSPGKLADITVLSSDILSVPEDEIREAEVVYTIVGGEIRHGQVD